MPYPSRCTLFHQVKVVEPSTTEQGAACEVSPQNLCLTRAVGNNTHSDVPWFQVSPRFVRRTQLTTSRGRRLQSGEKQFTCVLMMPAVCLASDWTCKAKRTNRRLRDLLCQPQDRVLILYKNGSCEITQWLFETFVWEKCCVIEQETFLRGENPFLPRCFSHIQLVLWSQSFVENLISHPNAQLTRPTHTQAQRSAQNLLLNSLGKNFLRRCIVSSAKRFQQHNCWEQKLSTPKRKFVCGGRMFSFRKWETRSDFAGLVKRKCARQSDDEVLWEEPNYNGCVDPHFSEILSEVSGRSASFSCRTFLKHVFSGILTFLSDDRLRDCRTELVLRNPRFWRRWRASSSAWRLSAPNGPEREWNPETWMLPSKPSASWQRSTINTRTFLLPTKKSMWVSRL